MEAPGLQAFRIVGLALVVWLAAIGARADGPRSFVHVEADGCPNGALLEKKLAPLLGDSVELTTEAAAGSDDQRASVRDHGGRYVVEVSGLRREFVDQARDCVERARVAAVLIALNVQHDQARKSAQREALPEPEPELDEPADRPPVSSHLGLQLYGAAAYSGELGRGAPGAGAGVWLLLGRFRLGFGAGVLAPTSVELTPSAGVHGSVSLLQLPLTTTLGYVFVLGRVELGPMLGLDLDLLRLHGVGLVRPQSELRLDPGVLAAADAHVRLSSVFSLLLRLGLTAFPRAYALNVSPAGPLAHTPRVWLDANLGLEWRVR